MSPILWEILILLGLILLNGLFALSEIAVVSSRRTRLEQMAQEGQRGGQRALELINSPTRFLSTVQVGITLIGILAGAFGGATLSRELAPLLEQVPVLQMYPRFIAAVLVVGMTAYLTVVIGELVPKRIGLQNAERIAAAIAGPMNAFSLLAAPAVRLLTVSTDAVLRLLAIETLEETAVSEEEIRVLVEKGAQAGIIDEAERTMVENIFRLDDRPLEAMMTPRPEIVWLDVNASEEEIWRMVNEANNSRFPVCDGDLDHVIGVVRAKELLGHLQQGQPLDLRETIQKPLFVPETMPALYALEKFKQSGIHMALLIDEYGGVEGLVTLIDILEAIVGDIPTPDELADPLVVQRGDGSWLVDGIIAIDDFKPQFDIQTLPGEGQYQTVGGFVVYMLGSVPIAGDHFGWGGMRFEVMDMDGNRVDKVLVETAPPETQAES